MAKQGALTLRQERFERLVDAVAKRVDASGRDPEVVLDIRLDQRRIRMLVDPNPAAISFEIADERVRSDTDVEQMADSIIGAWREAEADLGDEDDEWTP